MNDYLHADDEDPDEDLDTITARHGLPKPCGAPLVHAQIDLDEPALTERETCCCRLHGALHNPDTCCPVHRTRERAGIPVPAMPRGVLGNQPESA